MDRPTCETCPFWEDGNCRRYPPHIYEKGCLEDKEGNFLPVYFYPETEGDEWCGEHPDFPEYLQSLKRSEPCAAPLP